MTNATKIDVGAMMTDPEMNALVIQTARDVGLRVIVDGKMLSDNYTNVTGSFPSLVRFAIALLSASKPAAPMTPRYIVIGYGETDYPQAALVNERERLLDAVLGMMYTKPSDADAEIREAYGRDLDDPDEWSHGHWNTEFEIGGITVYDLGGPAADAQSGEPEFFQAENADAAALRAFDKSVAEGYKHDVESYTAGYVDCYDRAQGLHTAGAHALRDVIKNLRETGRYVDEEGEATDALESPLLAASPAALTVWYGSMPESNGKSNWTAILHRGDIASGMTLDRSEYPDRVRYEADRARWLIGELAVEPFILDYDADKHSGYVTPAVPAPGFIASAETISTVSAALSAVRQYANDHVAGQMNRAVNMLLDELGQARADSAEFSKRSVANYPIYKAGRTDALAEISASPAAPEYVYETYTGQCGWLVVSKEEYEQSEYHKRRAPAAPAQSMSSPESARKTLLESYRGKNVGVKRTALQCAARGCEGCELCAAPAKSEPVGWRLNWPNSSLGPDHWSAHFSSDPAYCKTMMDEYTAHGATVELIYAAPQPAQTERALTLLKKLKRDLAHVRCSGDDTLAAYRRGCSEAESEVEEFLLAAQPASGGAK